MNGHWRTESRTNQSRDEGLNELGQAPPPYVAKAGSIGEGIPAIEEPQIPLRTLSREVGNRDSVKPPDYSVVAQESSAAPEIDERPITPLPVAASLANRTNERRS